MEIITDPGFYIFIAAVAVLLGYRYWKNNHKDK